MEAIVMITFPICRRGVWWAVVVGIALLAGTARAQIPAPTGTVSPDALAFVRDMQTRNMPEGLIEVWRRRFIPMLIER